MADESPDARFADHWDACWAVAESGDRGVRARCRFALPAAPRSARGWAAATGLFSGPPHGFQSAADVAPAAKVVVNGHAIALPAGALGRGEAVAVDLAPWLREGANDLAVEAAYEQPPAVLGIPLPVRPAVLLQADVETPGHPLRRLATGDGDLHLRVMPARPPLEGVAWEVSRECDGTFRAGGAFLHPLAASPLLRLPRRPGAVEAEIERWPPRLRRERRLVAPASLAPGAFQLLDFGEELVGWLEAETAGPASLVLSAGESEAEASACQSPCSVSLPAGGRWRDSRRSALRYAVVRNASSLPVEARLSLDAVEIDIDPRGTLRTADPLLDRIYAVARRTVLRCTHDYVEDGVKRDRLLWIGDLAAVAPVFALAVGDLGPLRRSLLLSAATQLRTGALPGVGPHPSALVVADYVPQWVMALREYVWLSGDLELAALLLPTLRRVLAFLAERIGPGGLVGPEEETDWWVFLDWDRRTPPLGCPVEKEGSVTVLSLMTGEAFRQSAAVVRLLGGDADAERWSRLGDALLERAVAACWDDDAGGLVDWARPSGERSRHRSRFTAAWGVLAGVGTAAQRARMLDDLASPAGPLGPTHTGYGHYYNIEALFRGGRAGAALDLVRGYFGAMLARGATTFWESFDPDEDPRSALDMYGRAYANSLCHGWSGAVAGSLVRHVLGVDAVAPGFASVRVTPALGGLAWAEGTVPAPPGDIVVRATPAGVQVDLPPGVERA